MRLLIGILSLSLVILIGSPVPAQERAWELMDEIDLNLPEPKSPAKKAKPKRVKRDDPAAPKSATTLISTGTTAEQVLKRFGAPDSKRAGEKLLTEAWHYGQSVVFLKEQQVVAWHDEGDLNVRERVHGTKRTGDQAKGFAGEGWKKPWKKEATPSSDQVIDELVAEP